jgi:hypothetical protein
MLSVRCSLINDYTRKNERRSLCANHHSRSYYTERQAHWMISQYACDSQIDLDEAKSKHGNLGLG